MFCPKCGAQNPDGSQFCSSCGGPLTSAAASARAAAPKKLNIKMIAVLVVAVLAVFLFMSSRGKSDSGTSNPGGAVTQSTLKKDDLVGRWYRESNGMKEVFWFQKSGALTTWLEDSNFTEQKGDNGNGSHKILANWQLSGGNSLGLIYTDDAAATVASYFGTGDVTLELSSDSSELTFYTNGPDFTLQKYPESRW